MEDVLFYSSYFYFQMPINSGEIYSLEAISEYYTLKFSLPERISIG